MRSGGYRIFPNSGQRLRSLGIAASTAVFLFACAGTQGPTAIPEQEWSPDPVPARPAVPDASSLFRTTGKSIMKWPNATYETVGEVPGVRIPDFELPTVGPDKKSVRSPAPIETENAPSSVPEPLAWTGSDILFDSTDYDDNGTFNGGFRFIPPDPHAAAGPQHVGNVVNTTIAFHKKDGTLVSQDSLQNFFSPLSPLTFTFDPKILYDQYVGRWVVITMEKTTSPDTSRMFVAVSANTDPTGAWYIREFDTAVTEGATDYWADYPGFGVDEEAVYITANLFSFASNSWGGTRLWILDKGLGTGGIYDDGTLSVSENEPFLGLGCCETTTQPTHVFGTAPAGVGVYLLSYSGINNGVSEFLQAVRVDNPLATPGFVKFQMSMGNVDNLAGVLPDMPQLGTSNLIESNDRRALDAVWRDGAIWVTTTINPESGADSGQATAMWAKINSASMTIADRGNVGGEDIASGTYTTFPSIAVNADEEVVVGFSASAPTTYAGAYFVSRQAGDAVGSTGPSQTVRAGIDAYHRTFGGGSNRWGDYSGAAVDPVDGCFWVYNEWADTRSGASFNETGRWGTAYAKTCPSLTCSGSYDIKDGEWARFALPCDMAPGNTVSSLFGGTEPGDLDTAEYGDSWVVYKRDNSLPQYTLMGLDETLNVGDGYWVFTDNTAQVNIAGLPAAVSDISLTGIHPAGRDNYVGHNQNRTVDWTSVQVIDGTNVLNFGDYDKLVGGDYDCDLPVQVDCVMSHKMYKWNGNTYLVSDGDPLNGPDEPLDPFDGFWVQAFKPGIKLRIPVGMAPITTAPANPAGGQGKDRVKKPGKGSWHIRLVATSGDMEDSGNFLGQTNSASHKTDRHDLEEPYPFGSKYLSILFTDSALDEVTWGYTTDFRRASKKPKGSWPFVVKASTHANEVTLHWEGEEILFEDAWLVDEESGETMKVQAGGSYIFTMQGGEHYFRFEQGGG